MKLNLWVIPNARNNEIVGWVENALKVRITAPPIDGRANETLIQFLSSFFDLAPSEITLEKGASSKHKRLSLPLTREEIDAFLLQRSLK